MKIINLFGASLLMVSPFTFANNTSEEGLSSTEIELNVNQTRGLATTGGGIKFATYAASGVSALSSTYEKTYAGAGCESNPSASSVFFDESLNLPVGSIIVSAGFFYRDNNTGGTSVDLYNVDAQGAITFDTTVTGTPVVGSNSAGNFMWLVTDPGTANMARFSMTADPSADACMLRVGYIPFDVADDVIYATKFEY